MTPLKDILRTIPNLSSAEAVLAALTEPSVRVDVRSGEQTIAAVDKAYGEAFSAQLVRRMRGIISALKSQNTDESFAHADYLEVYLTRLTIGSGLDFSDERVRAKLDSLIPYLGDSGQDSVDKLKRLAWYMTSRLEAEGWETTPSLQEVEAAINELITERHRLAWVEFVRNGILANNGNGKSVSELKTLIAERE